MATRTKTTPAPGEIDPSNHGAGEDGGVVGASASPADHSSPADAGHSGEGAPSGMNDVHSAVEEIGSLADVAEAGLAESGVLLASDLKRLAGDKAARQQFRDLPREQRNKIIQRRTQRGERMMNTVATGVAGLELPVKVNHRFLESLFAQWWPFANKMLPTLQNAGRVILGDRTATELQSTLNVLLVKAEEAVVEAQRTADGLIATVEVQLGNSILRPTVALPAFERTLVCNHKDAVRLARLLMSIDALMSKFDLLEWNSVREARELRGELNSVLAPYRAYCIASFKAFTRLQGSAPPSGPTAGHATPAADTAPAPGTAGEPGVEVAAAAAA